ncbi:unnamed protein product [Clonostachys rosea f. rosea IK726]|uniref:Uncharacterized protein n=1 Tax=Clonostachys rosea f. rosea IK726 TaxID=1349383 RepID=A0ACA9UEG0_BIOOC|nr:unnamed protein product [Clonostachys rosea f. rosea IK726]
MARRYKEGQSHEGLGAKWAHEDDLTQMIAEESRKRQRKRASARRSRERADFQAVLFRRSQIKAESVAFEVIGRRYKDNQCIKRK